ncbi:MAG: CYTH and CHAD domain-containing protein [Micrococcales bacterium]|nr:CYTH and CHAD domain-containing protein [Micrococcales bacterium]
MAELRSAVEVERKYDVAAGTVAPTLSAFSSEPSEPVELRAVYYDTRRGDLARRRITLRRREGGHDSGWHLKLPGAEGRTELTAALADELPPEIADRVRVILRGRRVWPTARISTTRTPRIVRDAGGRAVAEFVDDLVEAVQVSGRVLRRWREWEVELLPDAAESPEDRGRILDAIEEELLRAGAAPASAASKYARATGRDRLGRAVPGPTRTALGALLPPLTALVDSCVRRDPGARADEPDAVHRYRVEVRRIRSLLAATRDVLDPAVTEPLRRRLHRLQTELEPARDSEVRRVRAAALRDRGIPDPHDLFGRYVLARAEADHAVAVAALRTYLDSRGYFRLLDELDLLIARPPLGPRALRRSTTVLRRDLARQARRAARRLDAAAQDDLDALHEGRKAVRRVRYLAEALTSGADAILGDPVSRLGTAAKALQDDLGDARDAELHAERLEELAAEAEADGLDPTALRDAARAERKTAVDLLARVPEARRAFEAARGEL